MGSKYRASGFQCQFYHPPALSNGHITMDTSVPTPWRREWQPTPVFLPGKSHGQRSLAGYSPWDYRVSDMTERLTLSAPTSVKWAQKQCPFHRVCAEWLLLVPPDPLYPSLLSSWTWESDYRNCIDGHPRSLASVQI